MKGFPGCRIGEAAADPPRVDAIMPASGAVMKAKYENVIDHSDV
jgi:hypothetical protein